MNVNGVPNEYDGNITFMGRVMARLPIDIHLSKLILLGYVFAVLDECVIMGKLNEYFSSIISLEIRFYLLNRN